MGRVWNSTLRYRVYQYLRQGFDTEAIVDYLGKKNRDAIEKEIAFWQSHEKKPA